MANSSSASIFIDCTTIRSVSSANKTFESLRKGHPGVTWDNVASEAGDLIRASFMKCTNFCRLPYGQSNTDLDGSGVAAAYGLEIILTPILSALYIWVLWSSDRKRRQLTGENASPWTDLESLARLLLFSQPRHHAESSSSSTQDFERIIISFFDTSVMATIPMLITLLYWLFQPSVKIYENVYSNLFAELLFGSFIVQCTFIIANTRHRGRFLVGILGLVLFSWLSASSDIHGQHIIQHEVLPFYKTLGIDCTKMYPKQTKLQDSSFTVDDWHLFTLSSFLALLFHFLLRGYFVFREINALSRKAIISGITITSLLFLAIVISAIRVMIRVLGIRHTFGEWIEQTSGQPWDGSKWSFGQILVLFMWLRFFSEAAIFLFGAAAARFGWKGKFIGFKDICRIFRVKERQQDDAVELSSPDIYRMCTSCKDELVHQGQCRYCGLSNAQV